MLTKHVYWQVSLEEYKLGMRKLGEPLPDAEAEAAFGAMDVDGSGAVSFQEFCVWAAARHDRAAAEAEERASTSAASRLQKNMVKDVNSYYVPPPAAGGGPAADSPAAALAGCSLPELYHPLPCTSLVAVAACLQSLAPPAGGVVSVDFVFNAARSRLGLSAALGIRERVNRRAPVSTVFQRRRNKLHTRLAVGETVILLHLPLPVVGVSIAMEIERQQNDSLANGYTRSNFVPTADRPTGSLTLEQTAGAADAAITSLGARLGAAPVYFARAGEAGFVELVAAAVGGGGGGGLTGQSWLASCNAYGLQL